MDLVKNTSIATMFDKFLESILKPPSLRGLNELGLLSNPSQAFLDIFAPRSKAGVPVNANSVIGLPAVWTAVKFISETFASLPIGVFEQLERGKKSLKDHPVYTLLKFRPNPMQTSYEWRQLSMVHLLLWGDAISLIIFDNVTGRPIELLPFHPADVAVTKINGRLWYRFVMEDGSSQVVDQSNVLHIKGFGFDGIRGKSVIRVFRESFGTSLAQEEFSANFYRKGAKLDGVIEKDAKMGDGALVTLRESWRQTYGNADGERVAILDDGFKYKAIGVPPNDSQFIETSKFKITEVARIFRVPPPLLYDLERATFSNIEQLILTYVKFSLVPLTTNWESQQDKSLLREDEIGKIFTKYNLNGLLRGDEKSRREFYAKLFQIGGLNSNEIREKEDMNPYDGGDDYFVMGNMVKISELSKPKSE